MHHPLTCTGMQHPLTCTGMQHPLTCTGFQYPLTCIGMHAAPIDLCKDVEPIDLYRVTVPIHLFRDAAHIDMHKVKHLLPCTVAHLPGHCQVKSQHLLHRAQNASSGQRASTQLPTNNTGQLHGLQQLLRFDTLLSR